MRPIRPCLAALLLAASASATHAADTWPSRQIRWVVPYPAGGTTDIVARIVAPRLSARLGQQVIVDNRPGAGNNIGTEIVLKSPPDGYTVLLVNPANAINATLYAKLPFSFMRDTALIGGFIRVPNVMEVTKSLPANSVAEFIAHAKANPGKVTLASSGSGTSVHLSGELFKSMTGIDMVHVPYKGSAPALVDLVAGQVHVMFDNLPGSIEHIRGGSLRALAVTSRRRSDALPNVPTVADTVPGYEATAWFGMGAPKGTPPDVVARLNKEINDALADPAIRARLADLGGEFIPGSPADFTTLMQAETDKWAKVVKSSGARVD